MSNSKLTVAISQTHTLSTLASTLELLRAQTLLAASRGASIVLFPEAFLGGYPRSCSFGAAVGSRTDAGREQFLAYYKSAVDLGDTPEGADDAWLDRTLPVNKETGYRGDGTREALEDIARETGVFVVTGAVERAGGSLYCTALFVHPAQGTLAKRRKVQPTGSERLVWAQGSPATLKAVSTTIKGVKVVLGCAICWENYMPLLRYALYSQGVNLWLAPTADQRATWEPLMRTVAFEGRCWVMSANQCVRRRDLPEWITGRKTETAQTEARKDSASVQVNGAASPPPPVAASGPGRRMSMTMRTEGNHEIAWRFPRSKSTGTHETPTNIIPEAAADDDGDEFASRGGSLIVSPMGNTVAGPLWDKDEDLLFADIDFEDCARGKLDFDASGHYARLDAFHLTVDGLDLRPPP